MFNVILYQPEIPPNTGNIIRLCANTGAQLHLIHPLGFDLDDKQLRRAGLDYHEYANVRVHDGIKACLQTLPGGHGDDATPNNEVRHARCPLATALPHPNPPPQRSPLSNSLGETTSHSTRLQATAAKSLVIPQAGERTNEKGNFESPGEGTNVSLRELVVTRRLFAFTTKGARAYHEVRYQAGDALLFGPESCGLPADILESLAPERRLYLPMLPHNRSLNLSNTVAVAVFEAWRQCGFEGAG